MIKIRAVLFAFALLVWLLLSGSLDLEHWIIGVLVGILISWLTADIFEKAPTRIFANPSRFLWFIYYLLLFAWECVKANLESAYIVLHPDLPIKPGIVKVRTLLRSDAALTLLANSLTLKPGTMTVDIDKEKGFLYIHWANVKAQGIDEATRYIVEKFERVLKRIFE